MVDPFSGPRSLIERAKHHIQELNDRLLSFAKDGSWSYVVGVDPKEGGTVHKIKFNQRLDGDLANIAFDCANNLRSVLDQTAYQIALLNNVVEPKSAKFPAGPTEKKVADNAKGGCKDLPPEITALFVAFKPYKGGNNALFALNELCNTPKHMRMVPVIARKFGMGIRFTRSGSGPAQFCSEWDAERHELVFLRTGGQSDIGYDANISIDITLDDVDEVIRTQHPVAVLDAMGSEVQSVLMAAEAECRRLGLIL